ncbi:MAG TPA: SpoIVB peptidase S55 domain-containing protein [Polyangiales bacterium]|nr:SpoIVB peptidase S55 domain-containing protein [Polyangiales bacterium]
MHRASIILFALGSLLVSTLALSQVRLPIMRVSEIKPGMRGYGLTVFRGEKPERFTIEVIDVLHDFRPDQDLILIRTEHPILDKAIAVGGMSGSPIFIDDKMIGAYAYGWNFGKEPVAGVTPIESMLAEIARPVDPRIWKSLSTLPGVVKAEAPRRPRASLSAEARRGAFASLREHADRFGRGDAKPGRPIPVATPLLIGGMTDAAIDALSRELGPFGLEPVQAGGGAQKPSPAASAAARFVDGGSIGVQLSRGDIQATATGTVTYVEGQRLIGFGHPMMNAGQVGLSTCTSRVVHILTNQMRSFKMAEGITPHGTLIHDRQSAIVVDQTTRADMVPMRVQLRGVPNAPRSLWNVELANHRLLTTGLTFSTLLNAVSASAVDRADVVFRVKAKVKVEKHGTIETEDIGYTPLGAADSSALSSLRLFGVLSAAFDNPWEDARVSGIDVELELRYDHDVLSIVDAQVASDTVDPGKSVAVYVTLRRFDESERVEIVDVPIPKSAAGDSVEILVEAGDLVRLEQPKPDSLDDLLAMVRSGYPATSLVVSTKLPQQGVKLRGHLVESLPGSALDTLQPTNQADRPAMFSTFARQERTGREVLQGSAKVKINVREEPLR